jgi:hypothetical protein
MAIKPILFNTEMVRAILGGRKTCTRRVIKPQWEECPTCKYVHNEYIYDKLAENVYCARCGYPLEPERIAPYQPGDILYVRETFIQIAAHTFWYKAYGKSWMLKDLRWKPSIHMPKEAARIWLKVTDVRLERLQEITIDGIRNEGLSSMAVHAGDMEIALKEWELLWSSTIKKSDLDRYGWDANPWVWVIEFERCEKPEGEN